MLKRLVCCLVGIGLVQAAYASDDCGSGCCGYSGGVYADLLYWKVCTNDLDFDVSYNDEETLTKYLQPSYEVGYRLGGFVSCEPWDLGVRYTSLDSKTSKKFEYFSEENKFTHRFDLDMVDIEAGYLMSCHCDSSSFRPFFGAKLAWVKDIKKKDPFEEKETGDYSGYGLYLGTEIDFPFWCQTSIVTRGSVAVMEGELKCKRKSENSFNDSKRKGECIYHPIVEAFLGLNYDYTCSCYEGSCLIGYETHWWGWRELDSSSDAGHLGFGGLTLRLGFGF